LPLYQLEIVISLLFQETYVLICLILSQHRLTLGWWVLDIFGTCIKCNNVPTHIISISALDGGKPLEKETLTPNE